MDVQFEIAVFGRHLAAAPHGIESAQVCLVGNAPELGAWDTTKAVPLQLTEESAAEKTFSIHVAFPVEREFFPLEYKYIIKDTRSNEVVSWETIAGNRTLTLTPRSNIALRKPANQSSTYTTEDMPSPGLRSASLGNSGNRNGFHEWRCARTTREANPWWTVDLQELTQLELLNLWKARTYHEQPKQKTARPPASSVRAATRSSAAVAPRVWVFVSSEDLSDKSGAELIKLAQAPGYLPASIRAFQLELHDERRVESVCLDGVKARYVCIQYESEAASLQFAEIEVFGTQRLEPQSTAATTTAPPWKQADGFYGVDAAVDADLCECVDSEWVDPQSDRALVRVWVGSFRNDRPAIQWFDGSSDTRPIHVEMRHRVQQQDEELELPVDARGASLLDKESTELRANLTALLHQQPHARDLKRYCNSTAVASVDAWLQRFATTKLLSDDQLAALQKQITTRTFQNGETLLQYGQHTRIAFFLTKGDVHVTGPSTSTGDVHVLGSICAPAAINDLALFSSWPEQCAAFVANGTVEVHEVTYDALFVALGDHKLRALRHHLLRERHTVASTSSLSDIVANDLHVVDAHHAQVFRTKLPTTALPPSSAPSPSSSSHSLELAFYEVADVGTTITSNTEKGRLVGVAPLLPAQLSHHGEGFLTLPILSSGGGTSNGETPVRVVGQVSLHYLVVRPFVHAHNTLANVWRSYWRERAPLNGGHRGMGRHFNQVGGFRKALVRENTLASFLLAGQSGADFVEFDVQLTKDHVPVLYHDFILRVGLEDTHRHTLAEQHEIAIHQLTLRELTRAQTSPVPKKEMPLFKRLVKKHWHAILSRSSHPTGTGRATTVRSTAAQEEDRDEDDDDDHLVDFYPRLQDLLTHVPPEIALNIEIKYPDQFKRSAYRFSPAFAINYYVDAILQCVFDHAGDPSRRIFFSCFDPDLVVALRAKQATYPVFFLTYGRVTPPVVDARLTLQFAVNFVDMEKLGGIVSNSDAFLEQPACVELVRRENQKRIVLMTWGDQNTSHACVQRQKRYGVDGVISDNMGDLTREDARVRRKATEV